MLKVWAALTDEEQEALTHYDWVFAPGFLRQIAWSPCRFRREAGRHSDHRPVSIPI
jgi:hypothetical protein